jgi:phosphoglycolate phosphatase
MIELCLFDFDGTLCATHDAIVHCMLATFDHYNQPRPELGDVNTAIRGGVGIAETFANLHSLGLSIPESESWRETYRTIYNSGDGLARTTLFDGAEDILKSLKAHSIPMVVVSNKGEEAVVKAIPHFKLGSYFDAVIAEREGIVLKPDPSSYRELIAPAYPRITPDRTLMIGDTLSDLAYAKNTGMKSCWARYGYGDPALCLALKPDYIMEKLVDIGQWGLLPVH